MSTEQKSFWLFITPLFFISFLMFGEHLIVVPLSANISTDTGLQLEKSGILVAIYPLAAAVSAFFTAPFSDRLGRKNMILIMGTGFCLSTLGFALANSVFTLLFFRILCGIFGGPIVPSIIAFMSDKFKTQERARAITVLMLSFSTASIFAVPIGSWIGDLYTWRMPFYLISALVFCCCLLIIKVKSIPTGAESGTIMSQYKELLELMKIGKVLKVLAIQFFMIFGLFGFVSNISVWLSMNYGFTATKIGLCYMQGGVGGLLGSAIAGLLLQKGFKDSLVITGSLVMGSFLVVATQEIISPAYIGFFFAGLMFGGAVRMPAFQIMLAELIPINLRGRLMSLNMIVNNISMGLGGIWSIQLLSIENGQLIGMPTVGLVGGVSLLAVPLLMISVRKEINKEDEVY